MALPNVSKGVSKNVMDLITEKYGDLLTKRQKAIISMIHDNPFVFAKDMAVALTVTSRTIYTELSYMQNAKIIRREGSRKTGVWIILE